jgi:hypothetical protein
MDGISTQCSGYAEIPCEKVGETFFEKVVETFKGGRKGLYGRVVECIQTALWFSLENF